MLVPGRLIRGHKALPSIHTHTHPVHKPKPIVFINRKRVVTHWLVFVVNIAALRGREKVRMSNK